MDQARRVASGLNVECATFSTLNGFFEKAAGFQRDSALFIDARNTSIGWAAVHQKMLETRVESSVVVVTDQAEHATIRDAVTLCADFVLVLPADDQLLGNAIQSSLSSQPFVRHRFNVERCYQRYCKLNDRESSILKLAVQGAPNKQIAKRLDLHIKTIERIRQVAYEKLSVRSTAEMTRTITLAELNDVVCHRPAPPYTSGKPVVIQSQSGHASVPVLGASQFIYGNDLAQPLQTS